MFARLRSWLARRRAERRARALLKRILADPTRLEGTSLRPAHAGRADLIDWSTDGEQITSLIFVILRHPRPHPFSSQHHLVAERWRIRIEIGVPGPPERLQGLNVSKLRGESDGRPAG